MWIPLFHTCKLTTGLCKKPNDGNLLLVQFQDAPFDFIKTQQIIQDFHTGVARQLNVTQHFEHFLFDFVGAVLQPVRHL